MKKIIAVITACLTTLSLFAQDTTDYPKDERTGKITFSNTIEVTGTKTQLFKRAEQFIIAQNFERVENIRCKDKSHVALQLVSKAITYKDQDEGKYMGNGFINFEYRGKERFVILFKYKIRVKDNSYKYEFTDFQVLEFVTAPKNKGKSKGMATYSDNSAFGSSSGFVEFSANDVRKWDLEEFAEKGAYDRKGSDEVFKQRIGRLISDLSESMKDTF